MDHALFWQTVGAVYLGCLLFAMSAGLLWRIGRQEEGRIKNVPFFLYVGGLLGPLAAGVALWMLP